MLLIKSLSSLIVIFLLMYFCFVMAKKKLKNDASSRARLRVIEHKRVDQKLSVSLIAVDNEVLLLAAGPGGIAMEKLTHSEGRATMRVVEKSSTQIH